MEYLKDFFVSLVENFGDLGLFLFAFLESIIQPFPVDPIIAAEIGMGEDPLRVVFFASAGTMLGALVAYMLGKYLGEPVFLKIFKKKYYEQGHVLFEKYGIFAILVGAVTPLPYKVVAWLAGIFEMPLIPFLVMSFIGRVGRYLIVAYAADWIF